jgi:hypothetical protein
MVVPFLIEKKCFYIIAYFLGELKLIDVGQEAS